MVFYGKFCFCQEWIVDKILHHNIFHFILCDIDVYCFVLFFLKNQLKSWYNNQRRMSVLYHGIYHHIDSYVYPSAARGMKLLLSECFDFYDKFVIFFYVIFIHMILCIQYICWEQCINSLTPSSGHMTLLVHDLYLCVQLILKLILVIFRSYSHCYSITLSHCTLKIFYGL